VDAQFLPPKNLEILVLSVLLSFIGLLEKSIQKCQTRVNTKNRDKDFRYTFRVIDLETNFCVAFGYSKHPEKYAFETAIKMLDEIGVVNKN